MSFIKGNYKKTIFSSNEGYTVGLFRIKEASEDLKYYIGKSITFTGYFHDLNETDTYIFNGGLIEHKKYGEQFSVTDYKRVVPEGKDSIIEFLSSGLFKGIGEKKAEKIVNTIGKDTLKVILNNPNDLLLIPTITNKNIEVLHNTLVEYEKSYDTILKLSNMGFTTKEAISVYNKYKEKTLTIINDDIYYIIKDVGISFNKTDKIALANNYQSNDKRRIKATILYCFNEVTNTIGNSYLLIDELYNYTVRCLNTRIEDQEFIDSLNSLIINLDVIKMDEKYYLKDMYEAEENISSRIKYLMNLEPTKYKNLDKMINKYELENEIEYNMKQRSAIINSLQNNFQVITGGPGTGKTTIVKSIIELYQDLNKLSYKSLLKDVALLAPTGRASKRLSESTNLPAYTIHRFLKWNKDNNTFMVNEYNKSDVKLVIVDESSMIDTYLLDSLFRGLLYDTKVVMVGDYHQLPSVGPGDILKDIIESDVVNVIELDKLYRQQEGSNIISLAYSFQNDNLSFDLFNVEDDLSFIESTDIRKDIEEICKIYKKSDYKDFQILAPIYKTKDGIDQLNEIARDIFNPKSKNKNEIEISGITYRENDKVIQLVNMPDENIFNGDIGTIKSISKKEIIIDYYGNYVKFTPSIYNNFKLGYVVSIHKSQGSEFDVVVLPVVKTYHNMLYRKLYYTGITRCKKKLIVVGDYNSLVHASKNNYSSLRKTTLKEKIVNKMSI